MLQELSIRNLAIIDKLFITFEPGFIVLTGETGAGKSIILDALTLVLGGRADSAMVRASAERAIVEAVFRLTPALEKTLTPILQKEGLDEEPHHMLQLSREVRMSGRSISRINGRSVSLSLLREIATPLLDIHGQGDHLSLLKPKAHLPLLDEYGGLEKQRAAFSTEVDRLRSVQRELENLQRNERLIAQRVDMLKYQIAEIEAAVLNEDEDKELLSERTRLANAERLNRLSIEAAVALIGIDDDSMAAADSLGAAERALGQLVRLDDSQQSLFENLQGLSFQLSELVGALQDYQNSLEFNPQRLNEVEERLELINTLKRKYGDSISAVLETKQHAEDELLRIENNEERVKELQIEQDKLLKQLGELGLALTDARRQVSSRLGVAVEQHLTDLRMEGARFEVQMSHEDHEEGAIVGDQRLGFDRTGLDQVEFVLSANPGEPLKPLAKVASGGETARLMLAIKTALAEVDHTPTLIFDEIDQGIGGRVGAIVGQKLWTLTAVGNHQVIVVTHLPQLAGYGDVHFRVSKQVNGGRTTTTVKSLQDTSRIAELAAMLGTQGDSAVDGAASILRQVDKDKRSVVKQGSTPFRARTEHYN
ncbi:MAG: DNA repair protein RecN [Candidatus Promineifilaceae bacterium]|nr:DNA repair protein RecN [Candidatus Promineifilaceae bacterium]